jgi:hypothetical protein
MLRTIPKWTSHWWDYDLTRIRAGNYAANKFFRCFEIIIYHNFKKLQIDQNIDPKKKIEFSTFDKFIAPLLRLLPLVLLLLPKGDSPLKMNFAEQLKVLVYFQYWFIPASQEKYWVENG